MKEIEKRLAKLEKKVNQENTLDAETLHRIMHSVIFFLACIAEREKLGRDRSYELSEEEKLELAVRLYESGEFSFTVKDFTDLVIAADRKRREEEGNQ